MIYINIFDNYRPSLIVVPVALIVAVYAIFQAHWPLAVCMLLIASGYRRIMDILDISKVTKGSLVLVIFNDASVQLRYGDGFILHGVLNGQQWCTSQIAVLNISIDGKTQHFATLSAQQKDKDNFRRLNTRLRHNFYRDAGGIQVSGN